MIQNIKIQSIGLNKILLFKNPVLKRFKSTNETKSKFTYKIFTNKIVVVENANDNLTEYYKKYWFYPITKYPTEYYKREQIYLADKKQKNGSIWKTIKYQYNKNKIIFKLLLKNYTNTAWYILNFRIKSSIYSSNMPGYNLEETLKNVTFKIIEEENQLSFIKKDTHINSDLLTNTVVETMKSISNDQTCVLGAIDTLKFIPYHTDKEMHSIIPQFLKISALILLLEEFSLILLKFKLVKPPFFAHLPETLAKQIDSENFIYYQDVLSGKSKKKNYLTPERFYKSKQYKKHHNAIKNSYMDFIYLDDLCFIRNLLAPTGDHAISIYREELIYKCLERNLFPKNYIEGSFLTLSTETFVQLYIAYLDSRYSETLMHSANGVHNIYDLS
ncbi:hypothetical protein QEN19_001428 [Hanseniaspora menglaensis]